MSTQVRRGIRRRGERASGGYCVLSRANSRAPETHCGIRSKAKEVRNLSCAGKKGYRDSEGRGIKNIIREESLVSPRYIRGTGESTRDKILGKEKTNGTQLKCALERKRPEIF
ncbi:hypothetical protein SUGI_1009960 [Cryptomeria japonica]|nr:hypothetical protein SUGI_1009960 [Cryptomeria japonica]